MTTSPDPVERPDILLAVEGLTTEFASRGETIHAVRGVSFSIRQGGTLGIVGESGSGKSVTIRSILGLLPPAGRVVAGRASLQGRDLVTMSRRELRRVRGRRIGFVAQNPFGAINPVLRLRDQFHNVLRAHGGAADRDRSRQRAISLLRRVGIPRPDRVVDGYAGELSGGMAQRVVIAMALLLDPELLVADEPTTALDVTVQRQILDLIRSLAADSNMAVLLVTHDLGVVAQYFEEVVVMREGRIVEAGPTAQVLTEPEAAYTSQLLAAVPRPSSASSPSSEPTE